jgi:hypothetical protein
MSSVYLVQYGRSAFVGRFTAEGLSCARGDRVVVRSPRGVELGEVLCEAAGRFAGQLDPGAGGDVLRLAGAEDAVCEAEREELGHALLRAAEAVGLPLTFLDAEVTLDGTAAVLHVLPCAPCDADPLFADLSARFGLPVRMLDISRQPFTKDPPTTCGKPDCGTGSGGCSSCGSGCSTGGCSRGSVKSADELTAYFADLRHKMEQHGLGRTPLH